MAQNKKDKGLNRIPVRFLDSEPGDDATEKDDRLTGYGDNGPDLTDPDMAEDDEKEASP